MSNNDFFSKPANIDEKGMKLIENAKKVINESLSSNKDFNKIEETMNEMYDYFSTYSEEELNNFNLQIEIFKVERMLEKYYLPINTIPIYNENYKKSNSTTEVLDYIVHLVRKEISKKHDIKNDSLDKECPMISYYVEEECKNLGIDYIHLGVNQNLDVGMFHEFTIVRLPFEEGDKFYLVDCSYRQFFTRNNSNRRRIGVMRGPAQGSSIGCFMMMSERRKKMAEELLTKGYIELNEEVFKTYFDSIIYSGRNSMFYKDAHIDYMNPSEVTPSYKPSDYLRMLVNNNVISNQDYQMLCENEYLINKTL